MIDELVHIGVPRRSGRYPWGSGEDPYQSGGSFLSYVDQLHKEGLSEVEIAKALGISTTQLRARKSIAKTEKRQADAAMALRLKDKGMSNVAIGERMGINESVVRSLLNPAMQERRDVLQNTADVLRDNVGERSYLDIGPGNELYIGVSRTKLNTAVAMLVEEGYKVHYIQVEQPGNPGNYTTTKVLTKGDVPYSEVFSNRDQISSVGSFTEDGGRTYIRLDQPKQVDLSRIAVRYGPDGGELKDGLIEIRRGVDDLNIGDSLYAQVRIAAGDGHYIKGMAVYSDNLPDGVDILFNSNKANSGVMTDALKPISDDPNNRFGAFVKRQNTYVDAEGKKRTGALNILQEEGDWGEWSRTLSAQMLSKQSPALAKKQLKLAYDLKKEEFDEIMSLTNPVVRQKLLESFADTADSASVSLKAAALPGQRIHAILPLTTIKDNEVYAPNYKDGDNVALIRYPHGGIFEIPELRVNNKNREARQSMNQAKDAIGINAAVASKLSGADFDGDFVLVIPNNNGAVKSSSSLKGLKNFDPKRSYPGYEGMKVMKDTQKQMGDISNLITDMTIKGASTDEIARAVRHSMVVIDAESKGLNYKQSYVDNGIAGLKTKYQGGPKSGASTLISKSKSQARVPDRKLRKQSDGGPIDPRTGKKVYVETGESYTNRQGKKVMKTNRSTKMAETDDAMTLVSESRQPIELIYANHANAFKSLANEARRATLAPAKVKYSPSAAKEYAKEVASLTASLKVALRNKPRERNAQLIADHEIAAKKRANPDMTNPELKKVKTQALADARTRAGAKKTPVSISDREWEAIQKGAISTSMLKKIVDESDMDVLKQLATPRTRTGMTPAKEARARAMMNAGYSQGEVASLLGVSVSTINRTVR